MTLSHDLNPILVAPRPVNAFSLVRAPVSTSPSPTRAAGLPSDALEEFLAILKAPKSPRRSFQYDRAIMPPTHKSDDKSEGHLGVEGQDGVHDMQEQDGILSRWLRHSVLSSPVSRMQTRNPFLKQIVDLPRPPLSPAAVPLPTPTPSEMLELDIQQI